jgi:hypothetical protein
MLLLIYHDYVKTYKATEAEAPPSVARERNGVMRGTPDAEAAVKLLLDWDDAENAAYDAAWRMSY